MIEIFGVPYLKRGSKVLEPKSWGTAVPLYYGAYINSDPFLEYWFVNRRLNPKYLDLLYDIDTLLNRYRNSKPFDSIEDYTKEETIHDLGYFDEDYYNDLLNKNIEYDIVPRIGITDLQKGLIYYPKGNRRVLLHEKTHSLYAEPQYDKISEKVGYWNDTEEYYDDNPDEIYSRLMELREYYNLNPNKQYTEEEIQKLIDKSKKDGWHFNILNRYNMKLLMYLFNDVASINTRNDDRNFYAKKGGRIHIKKKNRGKFTEYCGGEVTDKCIQKAKKSGNSKLVKRAVFALNARGWAKKHLTGGPFKVIAPSIGAMDFNIKLGNLLGEASTKGLSNTIKRRLYDNLVPYNYGNDVQGVTGRIINSVWKNKQEALPSDEYNYDIARDDIFAEYLGIPSNHRHDITDIMGNDANDKKHLVIPSEYKPNKQTDDKVEYKTIDKIKDQDILKASNFNYDMDGFPINPLEFNENRTVHAGGLESYFGSYTVGRGVDPVKGEYRSFYDLWDLNPFYGKYSSAPDNAIEKILNKISGNKDAALGIGKPIEFYDRVYLDDYYGVNSLPKKGDYYGGYLPEIEIFGFGRGGKMNNKDLNKDEKPKKKLVVKRLTNLTGK